MMPSRTTMQSRCARACLAAPRRPRPGPIRLAVRRTETAPAKTVNSRFAGVCTSITATTLNEARKNVQTAQEIGADAVEFRLDYLRDFRPGRDLEPLLATAEVPYVVTYRPVWEGGLYDGDEATRLAVLREATAMGAPFVDVELKAVDAFSSAAAGDRTELILSHHDYDRTPSLAELEKIVAKMKEAGADIVKIATTVQDITDCHTLITLLRGLGGPGIVLGMGEKGLMTRVLAPKYGGFLTFGAIAAGHESASGQPTVETLKNLYRVHSIGENTQVYGVIGNPVAHSKGPLFHNAGFKAIGYDGVYLPLLVDDLEEFVETFRHPDFAGYSVTIPHKEAALRAAANVDDVTAGIGACNTLLRSEAGSFMGRNTDWSAAMDILEAALQKMDPSSGTLKGKAVVVIGAGGVASALAYGAASKGARVTVANRTLSKAEALAQNIPHCTVASLQELQEGRIVGDVLANGTSLGMEPQKDTTPVPKEALKNFKVVFDAVYVPEETRLLREAAQVGCQTASGLGMFVGQAKKQFELFTGEPFPKEALSAFNAACS